MRIITEKNSVQGTVQKNELKSTIKKISLIFLVAVFIILGLALIVSGSCGALPLLPALIPGIIMLLSAGIFVTSRVFMSAKSDDRIETSTKSDDSIQTITEYDYSIGSLKFNRELLEKAKDWCRKELERRLLVKDPEDPSSLRNDFFYKSNDVESKCRTIYRICHQDYPEAFRLVCCYGEYVPPVSHLGVVVGCYVILMQSLIEIRESIDDMPSACRENNPDYQALPPNERVPYLLSNCYRGQGSLKSRELLGIQAGSFWLFRSYMALRTGLTSENGARDTPVSEEEFSTPGTDYCFARELFNDARRALLSVFSMEDLQKYSGGGEVIKPLCDMCKAGDDGEEFLKTHQDYKFRGRAYGEMFCN